MNTLTGQRIFFLVIWDWDFILASHEDMGHEGTQWWKENVIIKILDVVKEQNTILLYESICNMNIKSLCVNKVALTYIYITIISDKQIQKYKKKKNSLQKFLWVQHKQDIALWIRVGHYT